MTEEQIYKTLQGIYQQVPQQWRDSVIEKQDLTPTISKIIDEAIEHPDISEEKKEHFRTLKEAGTFAKQKYKENTAISKKIDDFVNRKIHQAVKEGRLPNKKKLAELKELWKKQKQTS